VSGSEDLGQGLGGRTAGSGSYIRGGGGVPVARRRILAVVGGSVCVVLLAVSITLAVEAGQRNSRIDSLRAHGVPVAVRVTDCLGLASGTGITEAGFTCRGSFTLDGRTYQEVIDGTTALQPIGTTVDAITVPGDPQVLYAAQAAAGLHASWAAFVPPGLVGLVALAVLAPLLVSSRRERSRR
jgi:hypothetical protein